MVLAAAVEAACYRSVPGEITSIIIIILQTAYIQLNFNFV